MTGNATYTAMWQSITYTVRFIDYDGALLKSEQVSHGGNATAPASPSRDGYTFTGWDRGYTNVTANITVTALYAEIVLLNQTDTPLSDSLDQTSDSEDSIVDNVVEGDGDDVYNLADKGIPLFVRFGTPTWSLVSLILAIVGIILVLVAVFRALKRRRDEEIEAETTYRSEDEKEQKPFRLPMLLVAMIMCVLGLALFLLAEDTQSQMALLSTWTFVNALILVVEIVCIRLAFKHPQDDEIEYKDDAGDPGYKDGATK